ncbi:MAG TPA: sigma-70 family RNA polymerase sigma factor [Polyangiaceae bacterium]
MLASNPDRNDARLQAPAPTAPGSTLVVPGEFSRLFTEQFRYVYNNLRRLGIRSADIEDATHDVFLAVYKHRTDWDPSRPLRPWLFAFAYRTASAYRRKVQRRREIIDSEVEVPAAQRDSLEQLVQAQQLALVRRALLAVDLEHRAVFILHDLDNTPMPDTAKALGIALNTGYSRLRAARRKFETALHRLQQRGGQ